MSGMKKNLNLMLSSFLASAMGHHGSNTDKYLSLRAKDRQNRKKAIEQRKEQLRFERGEKKYYLGDTELFVWARDEKNAQRKMKAKLKKLMDEKETRPSAGAGKEGLRPGGS